MQKTIITVATTGAWPKKTDNPNIPMTPREIADDVYRCWQAGAAICHLHMRDDAGNGTMNVEKFRETLAYIRAYKDCDIVVNMTTSGDLHATDETRMQHLKELRPDIGTFDCGSMNWQHHALFLNPPHFLEALGETMQACGVKPEIEAFDPGMIYNAAYYLKKGVLKAPLHFQMCMGAAGGIRGSLKNLLFMVETMRTVAPDSTWSAFGVGASAMEIMYATVALGGHLRVGMEDNVFYSKGVLAEGNVQFVKRARKIVETYGNTVATPSEARAILNL
ncbi:3-keto-5-aminohexanoate cleavage protein [Fusibacter paucivorans]|uniref:3-keto-5-aminohexanoate cleavage protein n=1 Tax=Fusibacter paucivorans TaxID=76009 RepID=A0ABS5PK82_9FIRM|nr:3-keto-5-aminohexanoate cleavage protein [Fusibacter paucivorans]MBS7525575.1 3-keto-5-aminohexanoate cleavage protein [Fusibacter paucivorans]